MKDIIVEYGEDYEELFQENEEQRETIKRLEEENIILKMNEEELVRYREKKAREERRIHWKRPVYDWKVSKRGRFEGQEVTRKTCKWRRKCNKRSTCKFLHSTTEGEIKRFDQVNYLGIFARPSAPSTSTPIDGGDDSGNSCNGSRRGVVAADGTS